MICRYDPDLVSGEKFKIKMFVVKPDHKTVWVLPLFLISKEPLIHMPKTTYSCTMRRAIHIRICLAWIFWCVNICIPVSEKIKVKGTSVK